MVTRGSRKSDNEDVQCQRLFIEVGNREKAVQQRQKGAAVFVSTSGIYRLLSTHDNAHDSNETKETCFFGFFPNN